MGGVLISSGINPATLPNYAAAAALRLLSATWRAIAYTANVPHPRDNCRVAGPPDGPRRDRHAPGGPDPRQR
jgi:hypothetical protein